jgi:hypothetical protein
MDTKRHEKTPNFYPRARSAASTMRSHRLGVVLDAFHQRELRAGAVEVVARVFDPEIHVALQMIGEEPQARLVREQLAGEAEVRALDGIEDTPPAESR